MGSQSFMPSGSIATMAHAATLGVRGRASRAGTRRRRKKKSARTSPGTRRKSAAGRRSGKPKPGTKAWMSYIRGMRKKKRK